ncbi:MAG: Carboxypeptidase precursor [Pseudomonadota bacterium]|jgi:carboxypeptidase T
MQGHPQRKLSKNTRLAIGLLCGIGALSLNVQPSAQSASPKRIVSVKISHDPVRRAEDLKDLSSFDILGVSLSENLAEVAVDQDNLNALTEKGFQIQFSPLNAQLQRENLEPYFTPTEVLDSLSSLSQNYPALTELRTIGFTRRKRPIQALIISAHPDNQNQPTLLFNAMHHAREVMTTEVVMHMAQLLLKGYGTDSEITHWLDTARIIVVPQVNPDGNQFVHEGQSMWRKNAWESEGRTFGVDINRNYPALWGACNGSSTNKSNDAYRGPAAASEPETAAMIELVRTERPVANISYHSFSEMILYPFGCRQEKNPSLELFKSIGAEMKANIIDDAGRKGTYALGTPPELLYEADGTDGDWQFREAGVLAFAMEVNGRMQGFQPSHKRWRDVTVARQEGGWKTLIRQTLAQGVQGRLVGEALSDVSYRLNKIENGLREDFTGGDKSVKPFRARSAEGFIFNTLLPGSYEFNIYQGDVLRKTVTFEVEKNQVTQLGDIRF